MKPPTPQADERSPRRGRLAPVVTALAALAALLALVALAAVPGTASAVGQFDPAQWKVSNTDRVSGSTSYELVNLRNGKQIGYENRRVGVDLGWTGHSGGHFQFRRQNARDHRRLTNPAEPLALYNTKNRRYLTRGNPRFGIGLEWSKRPFYVWRVRDVDGPRFSLYNVTEGDYLVYGSRTFGINLRWLDDIKPKPKPKPKPPPPREREFSVALSAQQVVQGYVPYLGGFGQGIRGNLLSVQNAQFNATIRFVKPGFSTASCANQSATVPVAPRATMSAEEMKAAFGAAQPRLPATFVACVAAPNATSLVFLNLEYRADA